MSKNNLMKKSDYKKFLGKLKKEIISSRQKAYQTINRQLVELYLNIGKGIYEKVEVSRWGQGVVESLAVDLQREIPDMKGFSAQNLWRMKQIYETYKDYPKLSPLVRELTWTHNEYKNCLKKNCTLWFCLKSIQKSKSPASVGEIEFID